MNDHQSARLWAYSASRRTRCGEPALRAGRPRRRCSTPSGPTSSASASDTRSLGDPGQRHTHATIGHATSSDLIDWTDLGTALAPDPRGWDDLSLWTGSVVRNNHGRWLMFFTALNTERGHGVHDRRIGVAESDDLTTWTRVLDRPAVEPDSRWYKTLRDDSTASETWRDPFVFRDPDGDGWRMLITARAVGAELNDDGVLGQARSSDLLHWEVGPRSPKPAAGSGSSR